MGLFSKKVLMPVDGTVKPTYKTDEPYDIIGKDHVIHVQKKLDEIIAHNPAAGAYHIVLPMTNELQIDYDTPEIPLNFPELLNILAQAVCRPKESLKYTIFESMSGNRHVVISCPKNFTDVERVTWQSIFGSDPKREALSMMSIARGIANPTLLVHRKDGSDVLSVRHMTLEQPTGRKFR